MSRDLNHCSRWAIALFSALLIGSYPETAAAAWTENGVLLSGGTATEGLYTGAPLADMRLLPDGAGGAFAVWSNGYKVFAQRVTSSGAIAPGWPGNGLEVAGTFGRQTLPEVISDGQGGIIVAWLDFSSGIWGQRITFDVIRAWGYSGTNLTGTVGQFDLATDGARGAYVVWATPDNTMDGTGGEIMATHVDDNGGLRPGWQAGGNLICPQTAHPGWPTIVPDGVGGAIIVWADLRDPPGWSIYAQRFGFNGALHPDWPVEGRLACGGVGDRYNPITIPDGEGGVFIAWPDLRSQVTVTDLYAQHIQANGVLVGTESGIAVSNEIGDQSNMANDRPSWHVLTSDTEGGAIFAWMDTRNGGYDIYANRLKSNGDGAGGWAEDGKLVVDVIGQQWAPVIGPDGSGGAFIGWFDRRNGTDYDVYVLRLNKSGGRPVNWPADGFAVCSATGDQMPGAICEDGAGGAILAWRDFRRGDYQYPDIYAMRVTRDGTVPTVSVPGPSGLPLAIHRVQPNPAAGPFTVSFRLTSDAPAVLEWWDVSGRRVLQREVQDFGPGEHALKLDASPLPAGVYFVRLSQENRSVVTRVAVAH